VGLAAFGEVGLFDVEDKVAVVKLGVDLLIFVPERLFCFGVRGRSVDVKNSVALAQFVGRAV